MSLLLNTADHTDASPGKHGNWHSSWRSFSPLGQIKERGAGDYLEGKFGISLPPMRRTECVMARYSPRQLVTLMSRCHDTKPAR
ncbi:hypothetical protein E2C01_030465 [Portunus trituberculatus]|uniref:Uncharacterized protein n=1 Tax=Portunus trituberculatus TaxID=210409 RepID=A0A5B7ES48_PORTR|nr:hypothetical protein [Portunus trituberculatus]